MLTLLSPTHSDKRRSRSRSLVPSALGSGRAGSQPLGAGLGAGTGELEEFESESTLGPGEALARYQLTPHFLLPHRSPPARRSLTTQSYHFVVEDQLMGSAEESMRESQQQAMADAAATKLELDSLKFLSCVSLLPPCHSLSLKASLTLLSSPSHRSFARRRAASQPHAELLFSDIVPVASTSNGAASAALYHLLNLTSKGEVRVSQPEAYGEVSRMSGGSLEPS